MQNLCDAPYLYDTENKKLMERNTLSYIWHFSHYIQPGAVRIGFSKYTQNLDVTAFKNPDGTLSVVILNESVADEEVIFRLNGKIAEAVVRAGEIMSIRIMQ